MNPFAFIASLWCSWIHTEHHVRGWNSGRVFVRCLECGRQSAGVVIPFKSAR